MPKSELVADVLADEEMHMFDGLSMVELVSFALDKTVRGAGREVVWDLVFMKLFYLVSDTSDRPIGDALEEEVMYERD